MDTHSSGATYSILHNVAGVDHPHDTIPSEHVDENEIIDEDDFDETDLHNHHQKHQMKREVLESFDFNDVESMMWRKVSV
jgi:hypothetical protein